MSNLTLSAVRVMLRAVGISIVKQWGDEYRVYIRGTRVPSLGYFTNDLEDALTTGMHMARERDKRTPPTTPPLRNLALGE
jgi:hypothetical protein